MHIAWPYTNTRTHTIKCQYIVVHIPLFSIFHIVDQKKYHIDPSVGNNMIAICSTLHLNAYYSVLLDWTRSLFALYLVVVVCIYWCIHFYIFRSNIRIFFIWVFVYSSTFTSNLFIQLEKSIIIIRGQRWTHNSSNTTTTTVTANKRSITRKKNTINGNESAAYQCASNHCFTQYVTA